MPPERPQDGAREAELAGFDAQEARQDVLDELRLDVEAVHCG
jgi:hypothetical protein